MKHDKIWQASSMLFILNMSASILNYLCQLLLARVLSVESFGTINTIFSFMLIVAVPGTTLTMIVSRYFAGADTNVNLSDKQVYIWKALKGTSMLALLTFLLFVVLKIPLGHLLSINDTLVLMLAFGLASLGFYQPLYSGVFSGNQYFVWVGFYSMLIPLYKIVSVAAANFATQNDSLRLYIVLLLMIVGTIITALVGHWKTVSILGKFTSLSNKALFRLFEKNDLNILILNICLMVYMNIDLLSIRYHEQNNESGLYSAVLLFGRIVYYFSTTLGTILLPIVASRTTNEKNKMKILNKTLVVLIAFSLLCMIPINIGKNFFIKLLYGSEYLGAACYVKYVSLISFALSLCTILVNYLVGIDRTKFAAIAMLVVDIILILYAAVLKDISLILNGVGIIGLGGAVIIYWFGIRIYNKGVISKT